MYSNKFLANITIIQLMSKCIHNVQSKNSISSNYVIFFFDKNALKLTIFIYAHLFISEETPESSDTFPQNLEIHYTNHLKWRI